MAISTTVIAQATARASATHPLDPLTADEIAQASAILKSQRQLGQRVRFETVVLREPDKDLVLMFQPGDPIRREAFLVVLDNDAAATYEAVVSLDDRRVVSWEHIPGVQPRVMFDEFVECEADHWRAPRCVRADAGFQAAIRKRGITDPNRDGNGGPMVGWQLRVRRRGRPPAGAASGAVPQLRPVELHG